MKSALSSTHALTVRNAADQIHRWGFGRSLPSVIDHHDWFAKLQLSSAVWGNSESTAAQLVQACAALHEKGIKIARVSKWLCFIDQQKFAIYDSRVSIALRGCRDNEGKPAFPIVPRRLLKHKTSWPGSGMPTSPLRSAEIYVDYVSLMQETAKLLNKNKVGELGGLYEPDNIETGWWPAHVEMALFMAGDVWPPKLTITGPH
ncbi:hypothetical protein [Burkholderia sp. PAMC 28687]|uniref:hypothetical protein n=1 Tax=Burkholderia sp. PAMC 28687 TaxID=1795874 RepID=UPI0012D7BC6C|nr:hypothetical protein [Burkholderia sp. PAMC 28687]